MLFRFGAFELDSDNAELRKSGALVKLPPQPFQVLELLVSNPGQLHTREQIQRQIWGNGTFVDFDRNLNVCMAQIRAVLNDDADAPRFIQTVPRRGYRFVAPVEKVGRKPFPYGRGFAVAAVLVAGILAAGVLTFRRSAPVEGRIMLAALPFEGDPELFVDGLHDELIGQLGSVHPARLGVIARTSVMRLRNARQGVDQIGRELHVSYVVEGSVRQSDGRLRVSARLIRVADQTQVWTDTYEQEDAKMLRLQEELAARIAGAVVGRLFPGVASTGRRARAENPEAYEAFREGRYLQHKGSREELERSLPYFEKAAKLDPSFAQAYASLADACISLGRSGSAKAETFPRARSAAQKAIELDDSNAEGHNALANVLFWYDWNWPESERHFTRAIEINPSLAFAHHDYAFFQVAMGRTEQGISTLRRAMALDPLSARVNIDAGWLLLQAHRFEETVRQARRALELEPSLGEAHACLTRAYLCQKNYKAALGELRVEPGKLDPEAAVRQLYRARLAEGSDAFTRAMRYTFLGEKQNALDALDQAYREKSTMIPLMNTEPALMPLHGEPRFRQLLANLKLN